MNKKIITIAEIAFALIFIILMSLIFSNVLGFGNGANANLAKIKEYAAEASLTPYDNTIVSGDTVVSTINKMKETDDGLKLSYIVETRSGWNTYGHKSITHGTGAGTVFGSDGKVVNNMTIQTSSNSYSTYRITMRPGDEEYISPVSEYEAKLLFNTNGVLLGVLFEEA